MDAEEKKIEEIAEDAVFEAAKDLPSVKSEQAEKVDAVQEPGPTPEEPEQVEETRAATEETETIEKPKRARTAKPKVADETKVGEVQEIKIEFCGHVNRHSIGVDGQLDLMSCELPKGHAGPHHGRHMTRFSHHVIKEKHIIGEPYEDRETESDWLDGAGIPVDGMPPVVEIKPKTLAEQEFGENAKAIMGGL